MEQPNPKYIKFLKEYYWDEILQLASEYPDTRSLYIRYPVIHLADPDFAEEALNHPFSVIEELTMTLKEIDLPIDKSFDDVYVRITEIPTKIKIGNIRSKHLGKFISIDGLVRKATEVRPKITKAAFKCQRCGHITCVEQDNYKFEEPFAGCEEETCGKKGPFKVIPEESTYIDAQKLQIQEPPEDLRGTQAQSMDIDADDDLAGVLLPGERVVINGILKSRQRTLKEGKSVYYDLYLEANSIERTDTAYDEVEISSFDEEQILELSRDPQVYSKMVSSIAPIIKGMDDVKEAMVLQQFSGVSKQLPDGSYLRGDSHILFCGDPSLGKTKLMKSSQARSPRAVFTSGKATTAGGLTAVVVKDEKFGEGRWTVEGGALVIADRGLAFIDEADKMKASDRDALHDAMEQQEIPLSKAGLMVTLKTRAGVFMSANPKHGKFDKYENSLAEQIDLPPSLLSRFDLIFVMTDDPEEVKDSEISKHILQTHRAGEIKKQKESGMVTISSVLTEEAEKHIVPEVSTDLFKKYVAYARKRVFPVLSDDAIEHIHNFYMALRKLGVNGKTIPITTRQEEAMVRLAEASARVRLSHTVALEDAKRATSLMQVCLNNVGVDPNTGEYDTSLINSGVSLGQRNTIKHVKDILNECSLKYPHGEIPLTKLISEGESKGIKKEHIEQTLQKMLSKGELLRPRADFYKIIN